MRAGTKYYEIRAPIAILAVIGNLGSTSDYVPATKRWTAESHANAMLISAAPDLLEALCELLSYHDVPGPVDAPLAPLMRNAFAAIKKATAR